MIQRRFRRFTVPVASLASVLSLSTLSLTAAEPAPSTAPRANTEVVELDKLVVSGAQDTAASPVAAAAEETLTQLPGAVHFADGDELSRKRAFTTADALSLQPGVFATASGGNDGIKLSIRGSAISNNQMYRTGIDFLFDGLSMPGLAQATPAANFEPLGISYTEILVGSNAFDYQSLALGGAINYVSITGYEASPFQARVDVGSYGYIKGQVSTGGVTGKADYYVSLTSARADGFQNHTQSENFRVLANFGYKFSESTTNRLYFRFANSFFETPGNLRKSQIEADPSQGNPTTTASNAYFDATKNIWVGNKTTIQIDPDSQLEIGETFNYTPLYINSQGVSGGYAGGYRDTNVTQSIHYKTAGTLFDRDSITKVGFRNNWVLDSFARTDDFSLVSSPTYGQQIRRSDQDGTNNQVLSASNNLEVAKNLWLLSGASAIRTEIANHVTIGPGVINNANDDYDQYDYNYVLGLRYDVKPDVQVFANVSRSVEPVVAANNRTPTFNSLTKIENQTGTTFELGTRFKSGIFAGSVSLYRTDLRNELLSTAIQTVPTLVTQTINASPTVHQGIEVGLDTTLWQDLTGDQDAPHRIVFRQTYTLNDFYFENDSLWGSNELPGVPKHYYQAELIYDHPSGFYAGVDARYASSYYADYANSLSADAYVVFGAKIGYAPPKKSWDTYLQVTNFTDEHYATSARTFNNAGGLDAAQFLPGDGIGVYAGFSFRY